MRAPGDFVAIRAGRTVTAGELLAQADGVARALPARGMVINACEDRYRFLVAFVAALARGLPTLLPPNDLGPTLATLQREWPDSHLLTDQPALAVGGATLLSDELPCGDPINPALPLDALAAIAFTSGSTGASQPQRKSWRMLVESTTINLNYYLPAGAGPFGIVSTVPPQHMYGLEASVLPVLRAPVVMHDGRPFFPADVATALGETPTPRLLVTTPVHLRAFVASGVAFPLLARLLCATAPLDAMLATRAEALFGCEIVEIYGCSEVGSLASRRTATEPHWRLFDGLEVWAIGGAVMVAAAHLPAAVRLPDVLEFGADGRFSLAGRDADVVKVAGKRGSIADITRQLLAVPGVNDAAVFLPPGASGEQRPVALVVSTTLDANAVLTALRASVDPVFLPRPLLVVPTLPRSATGKLPREAVLRLFATLTEVLDVR